MLGREKIKHFRMVLYHAISAYQLFEVMVHRKKYHKKDYAVLILPDFIVNKYPEWKMIEQLGLFDEVHLFNYMLIPHNEETVLRDLETQYNSCLNYSLDDFSVIYVAGAHFYFSIYLIENEKTFIVFEDAAGMLGQDKRLRDNLQKSFPIHAKIIEKYNMFDFSNQYVKYVICNQKNKVAIEKKMFYPSKQFIRMNSKEKKVIYEFFGVDNKSIDVKNSIILLTQNFVVLGVMTVEEQSELYKRLSKLICENKLIIKVHPDDALDYVTIFEQAVFLPQQVPLEVLASLFKGRPKKVITFSSTSTVCLEKKYRIINFFEKYKNEYSFVDEYQSIEKLLEKENI